MLHFLLVPATLTSIYTADFQYQVYETGERLLHFCTSKALDELSVCIGYTQAMADALTGIRVGNQQSLCIPANIEVAQLADVAVRWLQKHPDQLQISAAPLLMTAYMDAWCPEEKPKP